ncbi:tRNA methyltransferase complex GCD14 subunit-domain-containing protein [Catenaria anguillulae PL171]|uniref:tRNA (adenine(58)-N(1))-methyltransferase catalytic subunit TRM61 n=1 Tax=Catenaria anguillulae PL171 TaxID=765915 RepID=A0A1Y2HMV0_9FUNG|nr:tRNA methyltransferase complex GCD14 subunit-domain-containing protein [Catenaria anguillulae PL171]
MPFLTLTDTIQAGDLAILYRGHNDLLPLTIVPGEVINGKGGSFKHDDFIGKPWGSKFGGHNGKGHVTILQPTPELWTLSLPHRTQILYQADISIIMMRLRLKPGMKVLESGTGSGSFSHSLVRAVAPAGHLYTFEYHEARASAARDEFNRHGLSHCVTVEHRDVCASGFPPSLDSTCDAAFLDLPAPWEAVPAAARALRTDTTTRICCFSPCIEQVARTADALRAAGFVDVEMVECLLREHDVRTVSMRTADAGRGLKGRRLAKPDGEKAAELVAAGGDEVVRGGEVEGKDVLTTTSVRMRQDARGHTSYLTFATMLPKVVDEVDNGADQPEAEAVADGEQA